MAYEDDLEARVSAVEDGLKQYKAAKASDAKPARDAHEVLHAEPADVADIGRFGWNDLGEQLKAVADFAKTKGRQADSRLGMDHYDKVCKSYMRVNKAATGLNEFVGSDGAFLLAPTFLDEIFRIMHAQFNMVDECDNRTIAGPSVKVRAVAETSRATGSRRGGVTGYWVDEADTYTASKPQFRTMELKPHKLQVLYYATDELLEDGGSFLATEVAQFAADEINFMTGDAVVNGDGAGKPLGVLNSDALVEVGAETGQAAGTILYENVTKMWSRLHSSSMTKANWYVNQATFPQLQTMSQAVGTGGLPVYLPPGGASAAPYGTLFGRPVKPIEFCSALGTKGDIILGDFSQYLCVNRGGMKSAVSIHVEFLTDQQVFKFSFRVDGRSRWHQPLTPFKDTSKTQSPFVTLATRS